jgi:hypothetical protein
MVTEVSNSSSERLEGRIFTKEARKALPISTFESWWATEPKVARLAHGIPRRVERTRAIGNAVVPQCSWFVGMCIRKAIENEYYFGNCNIIGVNFV